MGLEIGATIAIVLAVGSVLAWAVGVAQHAPLPLALVAVVLFLASIGFMDVAQALAGARMWLRQRSEST